MPPIRSSLEDTAAFDSETKGQVSRALTDVCAALAIAPSQSHEREAIAVRIIDLARQGLVDSGALREGVSAEPRQVNGDVPSMAISLLADPARNNSTPSESNA